MRTKIIALLVPWFLLIGCGGEETTSEAGLPTPSLSRSSNEPLESWLLDWRTNLPVTAKLTRGSERRMWGFDNAELRTYDVELRLSNETGYILETGENLYLVETSSRPEEKKAEDILEVAGGAFIVDPPEDFSGVAEFRRGSPTKRSRAGGGLDDWQGPSSSDSLDERPEKDMGFVDVEWRNSSGNLVRSLAGMIETTYGGRPDDSAFTFGRAESGGAIEIKSHLRLSVMVAEEFLADCVVVTPELILRGGDGQASFRYLLTFRPAPAESEQAGKGDEEKDIELQMADATLLPLTSDTILADLRDVNAPLWRRVFAASWSSDNAFPEAPAGLTAVVASAESNEALRAQAIDALGRLHHAPAYDLILATAKDEKAHLFTRNEAIENLGNLGNRDVTPFLLDLARERRGKFNRRAIVGLGKLADPTSVAPLLAMLRDSGYSDYHDAIGAAIGEIGDPESIEQLTKIGRSSGSGSDDAIHAIGMIGGEKAAEGLAEILGVRSVETKKNVCNALAKIDHPKALAALRGALEDRDSEVRQAALRAIGSIDTDDRAALLMEQVGSEDEAIAGIAVRALAGHARPEAKPRLLEMAAETGLDVKVRTATIDALASFPGDDTVARLIELMKDSDSAVRSSVLESLGELEAAAAAPSMAGALADDSPEVRAAAAVALARIEAKDQIPALVEAFFKEKDESALREDVNALIKLEYKDLSTFPRIVQRLRETEEWSRVNVNRLLQHLSDNEEIEIEWGSSNEDVAKAIAKWTGWYEKKGGATNQAAASDK